MDSLQLRDPSAEPPLDVNELAARCLGRLDLVEKVLGKFQTAMDQELDELEQALRDVDAESIADIAHRIKGTSLTLSAAGLSDCAQHLETALETDGPAGVEESVAAIKGEWVRVSKMISTYPFRED